MSEKNSSSTANSIIPPPPPGTNYIAALSGNIIPLMIGQTLGSFLLPILIAVFFFSTPSMRRSAMFWSNVLVLVMGIVLCIFNAFLEIHNMIHPLQAVSLSLYIAYTSLSAIIPIMVEVILLLRILAVYPYNSTPRNKFLAILAFPVLMKLARFVNITYYLSKFETITKEQPLGAGSSPLEKLPNGEVEWFLQVFDNLYDFDILSGKNLMTTTRYTSGVFLKKLNYRPFFGLPSGHLRAGNTSFSRRLRALFWIATSNFVIPVFLSLAQAILYLTGHKEIINVIYINIVNSYVSIIAVVFATLWASGSSWYTQNLPNGTDVLSTFTKGRSLGLSTAFPTFRAKPIAAPSSRVTVTTIEGCSRDDIELSDFQMKQEKSTIDQIHIDQIRATDANERVINIG